MQPQTSTLHACRPPTGQIGGQNSISIWDIWDKSGVTGSYVLLVETWRRPPVRVSPDRCSWGMRRPAHEATEAKDFSLAFAR